MKKFIAVLLAWVLSLTMLPVALAAEGGRMSEQVLSMPDGLPDPCAIAQAPDGALVAVTKKSDGTWAKLTWRDLDAVPLVQTLTYEGHDIERIAIAPDGQLLALLDFMPPDPDAMLAQSPEGDASTQTEPSAAAGEGDEAVTTENRPGRQRMTKTSEGEGEGAGESNVAFDFDDIQQTLVWFDEAGAEVARITINDYPQSIAALSGRRAAVVGALNGTNVYDEEGNVVLPFSGALARKIVASGDTLYTVGEGKLTSYDATTGQKTGSIDLKGMEEFDIHPQVAPDGSLVLMHFGGLYRVDAGLSEITTTAEGLGYLFTDPSNGILGLTVLADGTVAALILEGGGVPNSGGMTISFSDANNKSMLVLYRPNDGSGEPQKDFTITALYTSFRLQKAASDFQRKHPELNVKLQAQMTEGDGSAVEDHIRTLNTDLLAGKGGDVLVMDRLPLQKYIQRGMLIDLSERFADAGLLPGIQSGSKTADGKQYYVPGQFTADLMWGKQAVIDELTSLEALADLPLESGQTPMYARTPTAWLNLFYPASAPSFTDDAGNVQFDNPEFARFLEALNALYSNQGELSPDAENMSGLGLGPAELTSMINGSAVLYPMTLTSLFELSIAYSISGAEESGTTLPLSLTGTSRTFRPSLMMGINSQSEQQALAEEFIRLVLSPEIQQLEAGALPTTVQTLDKLFADAAARSVDSMFMISFGEGNPIEIAQPGAEPLNKLRQLCDTLDRAVIDDTTLMGFIQEESTAFFEGRSSAEDAARAIEQRAWSYLNE